MLSRLFPGIPKDQVEVVVPGLQGKKLIGWLDRAGPRPKQLKSQSGPSLHLYMLVLPMKGRKFLFAFIMNIFSLKP